MSATQSALWTQDVAKGYGTAQLSSEIMRSADDDDDDDDNDESSAMMSSR